MDTIQVILVDDSTVFLKAATDFLNSLAGLKVVACANCAEKGLVQVVALKPDLVLIDVVMPEMNGIEAIAHIKQCVHAPKTVLLTLHNTDVYRSRAKSVGAEGFIAKDEFTVKLPPLLRSLFPGWQS